MGLFNRQQTEPVVKAAAASGNSGRTQVDSYVTFFQGPQRQRYMAVPTVSRARDLIAGIIGCTPLIMYKESWDPEERETYEVREQPRSWLNRLDPGLPNSTLMSWLFDDIFFTQRGFLFITERYSDGFPKNFTRLPSAMVSTLDQQGPVYFAPSKQIEFNGLPIDYRDVVQFIGPIQGLLTTSPNAVLTSLRLEQARLRNASVASPTGWLRQVGGEPMSEEELQSLGQSFENARLTNSVAVLNEFVTYTESNTDPSKQLLVEASEYQALEIARLANIPPYLVGVNTGSMNYQSSTQARQDLYLFAAKLYMDCIAETLSGNNVLPQGTYVRFDTEEYLKDYNMEHGEEEGEDSSDARNLAEMVQKIYLGVDKVITSEEARIILNEAGADLIPNKQITPQGVTPNA